MKDSPSRLVALGFSPGALPLLRRLEQSGLPATVRWPGTDDPSTASWLADEWGRATAVVAVGACGLVTRLIAPLLGSKESDPAVVVLDPEGRFAVPLLGGHGAGAEALSQELGALLGAQPVLTGSSGALGLLPLDSFGRAWGWRRGSGDWTGLMQRAAAWGGDGAVGGNGCARILVRQEGGNPLWSALQAARGLGEADRTRMPDLVIGPCLGPGCRWHPPCLWLGIGCERHTDLAVLERLVEHTLAARGLATEAVAGLASIDRKGDEPALLALAHRHGWPLRLYGAEALAAVPVPNPSEAVAREMGTASVAEAAALLAAGSRGPAVTDRLLVPKTLGRALAGERGAATLAVGEGEQQWDPGKGHLHLVGSGPGALDLLSGDGKRALAVSTVWVGYGPYLELLEPLRRPDQLCRQGSLTEERARCAEALELAQQGLSVALISSGDSGIYGMAGLALELWLAQPPSDRPAFTVHPGLSALQLAAARAGAPLMHDFCTISLSDRLTPWPVIEQRLRGAAAGDFVVALYNPRSKGRDWQLSRALEILGRERPPETPVLLARQLGRRGEVVALHTLADLPIERVDMLTLVLIGNRSTYVRDGRMVTPRGYPGAELA